MKKIVTSLLFVICYLLFVSSVQASYVLPYPSYMPGNKMYKVTRLIDKLKQYWSFGSIAKTKYYLLLSDKYLVEAKTLMEYGQFLLASDALLRSDDEFGQIVFNLKNAKKEGKDITILENTIIDAAKKHNEIIDFLLTIVPEHFTWTPEKAKSTELNLKEMLNASRIQRLKSVTEILSI